MSKFSGLGLAVDEPFKLVLLHPVSRQPLRNGDGRDAYIEHYSMDSEVARKHQRAVQRRRLASRGRLKITPEELEAESLELLAALTVDWYLVDLDGHAIDLPFSEKDARELYADRGVGWLREQLDESVVDRANFSKGSSTT